MKKVLVLASLLVASNALNAWSEVIEESVKKSDTKKFRNALSEGLTLTKEDKIRYLKMAREETDSALFNINQQGLGSAGRLAVGIPTMLLGFGTSISGLLLIAGKGAFDAQILSKINPNSEDSKILGATSTIMGVMGKLGVCLGAIASYVGIDQIVKVITHHDAKAKYDKALAVEAMLRRIKADKKA